MKTTLAKPLWQHGLDRLAKDIGGSTHQLDRSRARKLARGLRMLGERPPYQDEVSPYIGRLWKDWPWTASMVREIWRSVERAKTSLGRDRHWNGTPLYIPDMLIEEHGLRPRTEHRLAAVARDAVDALIEASQEADTDVYLERKRQLAEALVAVHHLRFLRQGSGALGFQDLNPQPAPRPRW